MPLGMSGVTLASIMILPRLDSTIIVWPFLMPHDAASSGLISTKGRGCSLSRRDVRRVMVPVWN